MKNSQSNQLKWHPIQNWIFESVQNNNLEIKHWISAPKFISYSRVGDLSSWHSPKLKLAFKRAWKKASLKRKIPARMLRLRPFHWNFMNMLTMKPLCKWTLKILIKKLTANNFGPNAKFFFGRFWFDYTNRTLLFSWYSWP